MNWHLFLAIFLTLAAAFLFLPLVGAFFYKSGILFLDLRGPVVGGRIYIFICIGSFSVGALFVNVVSSFLTCVVL